MPPKRGNAASRERKEKTAYKKGCGADTMLEVCPLDPIIVLESISTSTHPLTLTSQDTIYNMQTTIKTFFTTNQPTNCTTEDTYTNSSDIDAHLKYINIKSPSCNIEGDS